MLRIATCQINTRVGDLDGNVDRVLGALRQRRGRRVRSRRVPRADGHRLPARGPPAEARASWPTTAVRWTASPPQPIDAWPIVGFVDAGRDLYNAAAICAGGELRGVYRKRELPNYAVFDELRYFAPGDDPSQLWTIGGVRGRRVDLRGRLEPDRPDRRSGRQRRRADRQPERVAVRRSQARRTGSGCSPPGPPTRRASLVYVNQVGGQDELVFDGGSMVFDAEGELIARAPQFVEDVMVLDVAVDPVYRKRLLDPRGRPTDRLAADRGRVRRRGRGVGLAPVEPHRAGASAR